MPDSIEENEIILSRRDISSVKASAQVRSVPDGTAGATMMGPCYRSIMPDGIVNLIKGGFL